MSARKNKGLMAKLSQGKTYPSRRGKIDYTIDEVVETEKGVFYDAHSNGPRPKEVVGVSEDEMLKIVRVKKRDKQVYLSATQFSTSERCKRKWAFTYIDGEIQSSTASMEFGTEMHSVLEHYLKTGKWEGAVDAVETARQGEHALPKPKDKRLGIEWPINIPMLDGQARIVGFIDLLVPPMVTPFGLPEVNDHKSTKDLRYAETEDGLKENVQANIYAKYALDKFKTPGVRTRWLYYVARPSRAKTADENGRPRNPRGFREVPRMKTIDEVQEQWFKLEKEAKELVQLRTSEAWANDIEANTLACWDFGGCPFCDICTARQESSLGALIENDKVSHHKKDEPVTTLSDIIKKNSKAKPAELKPSLKSETSAPESKGPAPCKKSGLLAAAEAANQKKGINPPPVPEVELDPELKQATEKPVPEAWKNRLAKGHKPRTDDEKVWRTVQAQNILNGKPGGVPTKLQAELAEKKKAEAQKPGLELKSELGEVLFSMEEETIGKMVPLFVLVVDGVFESGAAKLGGAVSLPELLRPYKEKIQEHGKVPHWNLLKYREGETQLAALLEQGLRNGGRPAGVVTVDSRCDEWKACGTILTELADVIIRGV